LSTLISKNLEIILRRPDSIARGAYRNDGDVSIRLAIHPYQPQSPNGHVIRNAFNDSFGEREPSSGCDLA